MLPYIDGGISKPKTARPSWKRLSTPGLHPHICCTRLHPLVCRLRRRDRGREGLSPCSTPADEVGGLDHHRPGEAGAQAAAELMLTNHPPTAPRARCISLRAAALMQYLESPTPHRKRSTSLPSTPSHWSCTICALHPLRPLRKACSSCEGRRPDVREEGRQPVGTPEGCLSRRRMQFCGACIEVCPTAPSRPSKCVREVQEQESRARALPETCRPVSTSQVRAFASRRYRAHRSCGKGPSRARWAHLRPSCEADCPGADQRKRRHQQIKRYAATRTVRGMNGATTRLHRRRWVVGGTAGLTAATICEVGHEVTVFERQQQPGECCAWGCDLPAAPRVVDAEIAHIESAGVEIRCASWCSRSTS